MRGGYPTLLPRVTHHDIFIFICQSSDWAPFSCPSHLLVSITLRGAAVKSCASAVYFQCRQPTNLCCCSETPTESRSGPWAGVPGGLRLVYSFEDINQCNLRRYSQPYRNQLLLMRGDVFKELPYQITSLLGNAAHELQLMPCRAGCRDTSDASLAQKNYKSQRWSLITKVDSFPKLAVITNRIGHWLHLNCWLAERALIIHSYF